MTIRIIPNLLLRNESLVKTVKFGKFTYVGDPCNTVRIFNHLEVDELIILDILASQKKTALNTRVIKEISSECFMPLVYGGGIRTADQAKAIFDLGVEKISLNSILFQKPDLVYELSKIFGSQAIICSVDVKKDFFGNYFVYNKNKIKVSVRNPVQWAQYLESLGAGEILLTSVDNEGTWSGFDHKLIQSVSDATTIPIIANGGAGKISDIKDAVLIGQASAVSVGSMITFQKKGMGVLVNFPTPEELESAFKNDQT